MKLYKEELEKCTNYFSDCYWTNCEKESVYITTFNKIPTSEQIFLCERHHSKLENKPKTINVDKLKDWVDNGNCWFDDWNFKSISYNNLIEAIEIGELE